MSMKNVWFPVKENESLVPAASLALARSLTVIDTNAENNVLISACQLGGSVWNGWLWLFHSIDDAPNPAKSIAGLQMNVGASDAKFMPSGTQIVAADYSGSLAIIDITKAASDCPAILTIAAEFISHDDYVTCIDLGKSGNSIISGSMDFSAILWEIETCMRLQAFQHASPVTAISFQPDQEEVFATMSQEGLSLIWDIRVERPASQLVKSSFSCSSLDWVSDTLVAIGDVTGNLALVDTRERRVVSSRQLSSNQRVRRLRAHRASQRVAVTVDDLSVKVFSCQRGALRPIFESHGHKDCVSGLAWSPEPNTLYSCGWDTQVLSHTVPTLADLPESVDEATDVKLQDEKVDSLIVNGVDESDGW